MKENLHIHSCACDENDVRVCRVLIAPDSFKGSMTADEAARAIRDGIRDAQTSRKDRVRFEPILMPVADGGEGTLAAITRPEDRIELEVTGPDREYVRASYGIIPAGESSGKTAGKAVVEMASAAGLTLIPAERRSAGRGTTFGVGELIRDALGRGCRELLLTVGGSATNDGGCGMLAALGARFLREDGTAFLPTGLSLSEIASIDPSGVDPALWETAITVATDVKNPLIGPEGATAVYAPQKGATPCELKEMERGMTHLADLLTKAGGRDVRAYPGCGAGGGIAAGFLSLFPFVTVVSGIDAVLDTVGFDGRLRDAALVVTGEGKIDRQSLYGKTVSGVIRRAGKAGVPTVCFAGCVGDGMEDPARWKELGGRVDAVLALADRAPDPEESIAHGARYLRLVSADFFATYEPDT